MKIYNTNLFKSLAAFFLIAVTLVGITASLGGKAQAAKRIVIYYLAGASDVKFANSGHYEQDAYANVETTVITTKPQKNSCNFLGWTTDKESGRVDYKSGAKATFKDTTTLWPVWRKVCDLIIQDTDGHVVDSILNLYIEGDTVYVSSLFPYHTQVYTYCKQCKKNVELVYKYRDQYGKDIDTLYIIDHTLLTRHIVLTCGHK